MTSEIAVLTASKIIVVAKSGLIALISDQRFEKCEFPLSVGVESAGSTVLHTAWAGPSRDDRSAAQVLCWDAVLSVSAISVVTHPTQTDATLAGITWFLTQLLVELHGAAVM